jgi:hypothetical protein
LSLLVFLEIEVEKNTADENDRQREQAMIGELFAMAALGHGGMLPAIAAKCNVTLVPMPSSAFCKSGEGAPLSPARPPA